MWRKHYTYVAQILYLQSYKPYYVAIWILQRDFTTS